MSGVTFHGFRGKDSFGHLSVYTEDDGSIWARITLNGVLISYEQIGTPDDSQPREVTPAPRLPIRW